MICFLTSSPFTVGSPYLNPQNGFIEKLRQALPGLCRGLFVCSSPDRPDLTDRFAGDMRFALESAGASFSSFQVLDNRNAANAHALVNRADLIIFAGGHVPTQNAFFREIRLKEALRGFQGTVIGISAGSMNSAQTVYAQPEEAGEAVDPAYQRFLPGLGLTQTMLLPHYQMVKDDVVDGLRLFPDITLPDSMGRRFIAIPDGSYLLVQDGKETLFGEGWLIEDGRMEQMQKEGESRQIL